MFRTHEHVSKAHGRVLLKIKYIWNQAYLVNVAGQTGTTLLYITMHHSKLLFNFQFTLTHSCNT